MTMRQLTVDQASAKMTMMSLAQPGKTLLKIENNRPNSDSGIRQ